MRMIVTGVAALLLTGCEGPPKSPSPAQEPVQADTPSTAPDAAIANGSGLAFVDTAGAPRATLSCGAGELRIVLPGFEPIGSEDRLSIGTDNEAWALVADLAAPGPGVTASGAADPDLLDRLARGEALFASYGQQTAGPLSAASPGGLQNLVSACRGRE